MACIQNIPPTNVDSEREEGEIVDELDDLSDISSGEENLLLQRLHVLESYNHVLERKEAKRSSFGSGNLNVKEAYPHFNKLSEETSHIDFNDEISTKDHGKTVHHKHKSRDVLSKDQIFPKYKDKRRKPNRQKKKVEPKIIKESSDESDYEYRNKRRKLANAVLVTKTKTDSSLKARLMQMFCASQNILAPIQAKTVEKANSQIKPADCKNNEKSAIEKCDIENSSSNLHDNVKDPEILKVDGQCIVEDTELINLSSDDGSIQIVPCTEIVAMSVDENLEMNITAEDKKQCKPEEASDEDLELLRQCALKSKTLKNLEINKETLHEPVNLVSEDEDSDTAELRLICLRSALLKKAIEMKQKQKLRRKLSQSTLYDDVISNELDLPENKIENNTDTESVDMDIGSDDPGHDNKDDNVPNNLKEDNLIEKRNEDADKNKLAEDDIEEDEDLLRAKLLTSLSKNLPNLVDSNKLENEDTISKEENLGLPDSKQVIQNQTREEKRFIIHTGDSDSDEPEATKNLTKMHLKLSEQPDFQQKLDQFLKSARMEVENTKLPDLVQPPNVSLQKKFIPKALKHLPKNEMIEYNKLVKRMAELEKLKKARLSMTFWDNELKGPVLKEALNSRNVTIDTSTPLTQSVLDEEIALSRKTIAEESAKVLRLKEEHTSLIQKYKIVETELRNLSTAIAFNKRNQKIAQIQFSKSRAKHQMLLKRSTTLNYNNHYSAPQVNTLNRPHNKVNMSSKLQKENEPLKVQQFDKFDLKSVKVSVVNDLKEQAKPRISEERLSIQIDVANNKKVVKIPKEITPSNKGKGIDDVRLDTERDVAIYDGEENTQNHSSKADDIENDYKSPLQALTSAGWNEDPNGVLCPFDVGGSCKDANCKYLHPKDSSH